jgi:hypothetical protein
MAGLSSSTVEQYNLAESTVTGNRGTYRQAVATPKSEITVFLSEATPMENSSGARRRAAKSPLSTSWRTQTGFRRVISRKAVSGPLMKKYDTVTDLSNDFRERRFPG